MSTVQNELVKLLASDGTTNDYFGMTVAISGNYAIVGANGDDDNESNSGSAYIFELSNGTWTEKQKLLASDADNNDRFGHSVAISGNYAIVGAYYNDDNGSNSGSTYIFELSNGTWSQKQKLLASDGAHSDSFGASVAISGNYAIVGAYGNDDNGDSSGSAYIFELSNGTWTEKQKLLASDADNNDRFGHSVAISGNYAIVGAYYNDDNGSDSGSAYIFELSNGNWSEKQKLLASDGASGDYFGSDVAISGNYAIVGANGDDDNGSGSGSAYIFELSNGTWSQKQKLLASDGAYPDSFGGSVAISGIYAVVGAYYDDDNGSYSGSAYIFELSNGTWSQKQKLLASDGAGFDYFGHSVAISGNYAIVGAYADADNTSYSGSAYIFEFSGNGGSSGSVAAEEQALIDLSVQTADIDVLRAVAFSNKSNGKGDADATSRAKVKALMTSASSDADKRKKRRAALKFLFSLDTDVTKMVIPKDDLDLPAGFKKANALVLKAGQTMAVSDLAAGEGFYSVLDNEETVSITTDNTSLTFTRGDVGDNELYTVSATTWTDITINTDEVSGGNFAENNNTGTLAPGDIVAIDGRKFIIGSVADGGSAASGGDPYVFPMKSNCPVKLPNKPAVYRMFEQGDNYVNVEVAEATEEHKRRMIDYASKLTPVTHNVVTDGYFYSKAFISAEGHQLTVDYASREVNTDESSMDFFTIKQGKNTFDCGDFKEEAKCWTVGWTTSEGKRIEAKLLFFSNPHLENGVSVVPSTLKNSIGLIVDNYKPKLMELPSLTTEKFSKLHRRLAKAKNMRQKMNIRGKNEKWVFN
jgi:esterase/lipase superfamily enzyme